MSAVDLADAQAHPVDRVEAGDSFEITRYGRPVAHLSAANRPCRRIALALLQALTAIMPQTERVADPVTTMRDHDRY